MADMFEVRIKADNIEEVKQILQNRSRVAMNAVGIQAATLAGKELQHSPARIDTGLLRNSIAYALDGEPFKPSGYSADRPSKYSGKKPPSGSYSGSTPKEGIGKAAVYVGSNVTYAVYVHEGTDRMPPNRFLKNAIENNQGELAEIIKKYLAD